MTVYTWIFDILGVFINFIFNVFRLPNTSNVYLGWVIIAVVVMGMTIKAVLNVATGIQPKTRTKEIVHKHYLSGREGD